jgi:hypothetical protein
MATIEAADRTLKSRALQRRRGRQMARVVEKAKAKGPQSGPHIQHIFIMLLRVKLKA